MLKPKIITDYPIAYTSQDHLEPVGSKQDNSKNEAYVNELISIFGSDMAYMDLGCAGGGFVAQFLEKNVLGVGVEGSDYSLNLQRAEWANYKDYLFTADIEKPFKIVDENDNLILFDAISAFDVLEHIHEECMDQLFETVKMHLKPNGWFVTGIADFPHQGYHVTVKPLDWWNNFFRKHGFVDVTNKLINFGRTTSYNLVHAKG